VIRNAAGETVLRDERAPDSVGGLVLDDGFGELDGQRRFVLTDAETGYSILLLETSDRRDVAFRDSFAVLVLPLLALVPLIVAGVWFAMRQALRPLQQLRRAIAERDSRNLAPVDATSHPAELAPIAEAVDALLTRLKSALDAERAFAARSAHELRTPLAGALAQVQQLATELEDPHARHRLGLVEASLTKLSRLSDKLLQLARVEAGFARTETPVDLLPVLAMTVRDINTGTAWRDRVILQTNSLSRLEGTIDADAFAIVMRNLIENALKHGAPGRPVQVVVAADGQSIRVINEGRLVPEAELATLGRPFSRGETIAPGSGLGLSIVGGILEQVGGRLTLRSPAEGKDGGFEAVVDLSGYEPRGA
jgi:two-component system OmpR family sensor kinase